MEHERSGMRVAVGFDAPTGWRSVTISGRSTMHGGRRTSLGRWGRMLTRKLDIGVVLATPDGRTRTVHDGDTSVTVTAEPGELMLRLFGRPLDVDLGGDPSAVQRCEEAELGI